MVAEYSYNLNNQLTCYREGEKVITYSYNADGLRDVKSVGRIYGIDSVYAIDTEYVWSNGNLVAEKEQNGTTAIYNYGIDGIATRKKAGKTDYYVKNIHGDVTALTDSTGTITKSYQFDAFGNELAENDNDTNPFRYCGEYYDAETGLIYLRNRYYDTATGRFITEDPVKDGLNWYAYCANNPIRYIDPTGYITDEEQKMFENGEMAPGAYSFLMVCTYYYYLEDTDEGREWWHTQAQNFRDSGYTDTGNEYWNWTLTQMSSRPSGETISKDEHYFRNNLNIQFEWDDFEKLNTRLPDNLKWRELPWYQSIFHKFSFDTPWQGNNRKYVSACEHFEAVYTKENYLVDAEFSSAYMGTYNYYGPTQADKHKKYDVDPYFDYGNVR